MNRLIAAAFILPFLVAYIYFLPESYFLGLLIAVSMISMKEFCVMYKVPARFWAPGVLVGGALFFISCIHPEYFKHAVFISLFLMLLLRLLSVKTPVGTMSEIGPLGVGFFYIFGFLVFQWFLRNENDGWKNIFLLYNSVWLADGAAYYIGTYTGKNRLYPAVSPNKSFEGALGSVLGGAIGALITQAILSIPDFTAMKALMIGAILGLAAVTGDLIESMFKRDAGVKDSSNLIPGHGGLLDKIDGLLIAGPILYLLLYF
ncbi:MAG: phosphatidate cytidylyltransferase [Nitrospirota bacterium]